MNEDAVVTTEDNILIASYNGKEYDRKHKDSTTNVGAVDSAKDADGKDVATTVNEITDTDLPDANLLDSQKAAAVDSEHTAEQLDVV